MKQKIKNITAIFLSIIFILSSVGLNIFVHTCKADGIVEYSFVSHSDKNGLECQYCSESVDKHSCILKETVSNECCANIEDSKEEKTSLNLNDCCKESFETFKLDFDAITSLEINIDLRNFEILLPNFEIFSIINSAVKPFKYLAHYSGISPPYEHHYIHFISSILE